MSALSLTFFLLLTMQNGINGKMASINATFFPEMYKIDDISQNRSELDTKELSVMFEQKEEMVDDFADLFSSSSVKICWALTMVTDFFVCIPLFFFFLLFDKYGEDSMKRSLYNYLTSQISYPVIIQSIVYNPMMAWRIYIGPLNSIAADFNVFILNSTVIWGLICLTEAVLVKAISATKYKYIRPAKDTHFSEHFDRQQFASEQPFSPRNGS